jgi:hypothetical protein
MALPSVTVITYLSYQLSGMIEKLGPHGVFINEENKTLVAWILDMQEVGLSITL